MSESKNSIKKAIVVTLIISVIASVFVSTIAVSLKDLQEINKIFDKKKNILAVANLISLDQKVTREEIDAIYKNIDTFLVDFNTGEKVKKNIDNYNQKAASRTIELSSALDSGDDIASIKRRENYGFFYEIKKNGKVDTIVIPIRGYGLWSTLYGFLALSADAKTVKGITFYEHGETPGLGGEVDNPRWKKSWIGKTAYNEDGKIVLKIVKGFASPNSKSDIDGLSGATITSRGVDNMIKFWLSESGYGKFLKNHYFNKS